ncbi:SID1 transmembrane family member 2,SID1 transmembrane family member 1 [Acanthosepion pharaonis]|uniref:SID1 transmembrane family member 2,SID1 transmembrane family member 1 n=1 Tax=Acanthosepion pharaonis TaxID=158019 RepID=A0A812DJ13_ACAPH|nr:SID1 transmembrane family member 2,SID1 transmembrane family member 1 [Sepia pharaonis]
MRLFLQLNRRIWIRLAILCCFWSSSGWCYIGNKSKDGFFHRHHEPRSVVRDGRVVNITTKNSSEVKSVLNPTHGIVYVYRYEESRNETTALRVSTQSKGALDNFPVIFVVRQQEGVISWTIPFYLDFQYEFYQVSRTLCPVDKNHRKDIKPKQDIIIEVSSLAENSTDFYLTTSLIENFELRLGEKKDVTVTPTEPKYYMFSFPLGVESVIVTGNSKDTNCLTMSIQDIRCPVYDMDRNIRFHGLYQTMSKEAAIVVQNSSKLLTENAFYVVLVLMPNNMECSSIEEVIPGGKIRSKNLTILINNTTPVNKYSYAIVASVGVFFMVYVIAGVIILIFYLCDKNEGFLSLSEQERGIQPAEGGQHSYGTINRDSHTFALKRYGSGQVDDPTSPLLNAVSPSATTDDSSSVNSSLDTQDIDFLHDAEEEKDVFRTKTALFVSDLSRKGRKKLAKYGKVYNWNLWTIVIFYGLPVVQLMITYQKVLHLTGNEDTCYYNFKCAMPFGVLSAFNNVFSNIGYVMLGILFLLLVWRRDLLHRETVKKFGNIEQYYGIPQPYGLFYAMGLGLCMEGVMSACYHVCPTYSNFQFDTSFMYIIACLCMLRLYQTRHPDINAKAHTAYLYMAFIIFIAVIGVVYQNPIFWIIFAVIHFITTLVLSVQIYYMGRWKIDLGLFNRMRLMLCSDFLQCARPMYKDRLILLIIGNILNWSFAVYGAVKKPSDFASYLLAIFIGNLLFYLFFYLIMKLRSKESIKKWTWFYIIMTCVLWGFALYFFLNHLTSWQLLPAESRDKNHKCILLDFYDAHDIWHFLSASSMFFSFMILLTLDDDLQLIRRDRIPVF